MMLSVMMLMLSLTVMMLFKAINVTSYQLLCTRKLSSCQYKINLINHQQQQHDNFKFILKSTPTNNTPNLMKSNVGLNIFNALRPLIVFYVVMLAPIYGIGLPLWFGSITDFSTLKNRFTFNEYIVTPKGYTNARINEVSSIYPVSSNKLHDIIDLIVLKQERINKITDDISTKRIEYVQRSLIFRFPDVITFQVIPISDDKSTLAVHSYSIYGGSDLGVNGNRIRSWLSEIEDTVDNQ